MPHYKNGQPAQVGDLVACQPAYANAPKTIGIVIYITVGSESCNAQLVPVAKRWLNEYHAYSAAYAECVTLSDCLPLVEALVPQEAKAEAVPVGGS